MADITGSTSEKVFTVDKWLGLHECPDGDTGLKLGEAAAMRNFRVTRDGNLKKRPGLRNIVKLYGGGLAGLWTGIVNGVEVVLSTAGGMLYSLWDADSGDFYESPVYIGSIANTGHASFIGFENKVYILTGGGYFCWDGTELAQPEGYRPLVTIVVPPAGGGETLEQVNKLNGKRRIWISPDGKSATFQLPETGLLSIDWVTKLSDSSAVTDFTYDLTAGTVTFSSVPEQGTNTYEIAYSVSTNFRSQVDAMKYAELYNGSTDSRVFIYGDGSNETFYSGVDYDGIARADYFPDENEIAVGDSNTPITALIRHYSMMVCYKSSSAWTIKYTTGTLSDGSMIAEFNVVPVNRAVGNECPGQVCLVDNSPRTVFGHDIYQWKNTSSYSSNLTVDERQAKVISQRVFNTLSGFDNSAVRTYDDNLSHEYYIWENGGTTMVVNNYENDTWYTYTGLPVIWMARFHDRLLCVAGSGYLAELTETATGDMIGSLIKPIDCYWESGSESFGADYLRKYSAYTWLAIKPETHSDITMTVKTDRSVNYAEKEIESMLTGFDHLNFADFMFVTSRRPKIKRLKLKAKKFVYYKMILESSNTDATATVTGADIKVRYTGNAK